MHTDACTPTTHHALLLPDSDDRLNWCYDSQILSGREAELFYLASIKHIKKGGD